MKFTQVLLSLFLALRAGWATGNHQTAVKDSTVVASQIKQLETDLAQAVVGRDYEVLRRIEAPNYVYTDSDAKVSTREEFIRSYQAGTSRVKSLRFDEMVVNVYRDAAVVRGLVIVDREDEGVVVSRVSRYTRFYVRFTDGWRAVAGHSSKLKESK